MYHPVAQISYHDGAEELFVTFRASCKNVATIATHFARVHAMEQGQSIAVLIEAVPQAWIWEGGYDDLHELPEFIAQRVFDGV